MKRLALLSVVSLMLASAVFAPVAMAQELGAVDVKSVRLGPGGSVTVTATVECVAGYTVAPSVEVRQKTRDNTYNVAYLGAGVFLCEADGPTAFTVSGFGRAGELERPFHRGPATVQGFSTSYPPDFSTSYSWSGDIQAVNLR
jgi:hypothetical protein